MNKKTFQSWHFWVVTVGLCIWIFAHIPGLVYGTHDLPLHASYVGDEQAPINGALHMLEEKSLLGLRNKSTAYYGPIFSLIAVPAVLFDAGVKYAKGEIHSALEYKQSILFDWGMIAFAARCISLIFSVGMLFALYYFLKPKASKDFSWTACGAVSLIALNYYFFEYSHFFKHWIFMIAALSLQWLSLKYILEGKGKRWWYIHVLAAVFGIGINFFSAIGCVMWLPAMIRWIRRKDFTSLRYLARSAYALFIATLLIIWWHPSTFLRYLGMAGVQDVSSQGTAGVQNLFDFSHTSTVYYSSLVFFNLLPLFAVLVLFLVFLRKEKIYARIEMWVILLPGIANFLFFIPPVHHEGRYMLPTILSLVLFVGFLLVEYHAILKNRFYKNIIYILLGYYAIFNVINIVGWIQVYARGPVEQVMLQHVLAQSETGKGKVLLIQSYIAGHVHTKEAYERYARNFNKEGFNLYKEIFDSPLPKNVPLLNATYMTEKQYLAHPDVTKNYDQVVFLNVPRKELNEINQFDFVDENITRIWHYDDLMPSYTYLK